MTRTDRPTHLRLAGSDAVTRRPQGDLTSSLALSMYRENDRLVARVQAGGVLGSETLPTLVQLAHLGIFWNCAELIIDVRALTDFPVRLFTELHGLSHAATAHRILFRLVGLPDAISAAVESAIARH